MTREEAVLVADGSDERRRSLGLKLFEGGYETINAVDGAEALRFATGLDPTLVIVHTGLPGLEPLDLWSELERTDGATPPLLILHEGDAPPSDELPDEGVYLLSSRELEPEAFLQQVRLLLLSRHIGGVLSEPLDAVWGDLTRVSIGELLRVLGSFRITGTVEIAGSADASLWVNDGEVVDAAWGAVVGIKAFNRIAALRAGRFRLVLDRPYPTRNIGADPASLISDAVDAQLALDEALGRLPQLTTRPRPSAGPADRPPLEAEILRQAASASSLAELLDRVPAVDHRVATAVRSLVDSGDLTLLEPEHRIRIVTDSTSDLSPDMLRRQGIDVVPLSVIFGEERFTDGVDLQPDQFYGRLSSSDVFPSTSPPDPSAFLSAYRDAVVEGDVLSIHISGKLSQTIEHARGAVEQGWDELEGIRTRPGGGEELRVRTVDSWQTSVGLGLLVVLATRMVRRGRPIDETADWLDEARGRCHLLFAVDTLEYLQKGGRIGKAQAFLGGLLGIKPILALSEGEVVPLERVRGGRRAHPKLMELFEQRVDRERPLFAAVGHASAPKWAGRLQQLLAERFDVIDMLEGEIGPVVGAHTGPGTVGACLFQPTDEELDLLRPRPGD